MSAVVRRQVMKFYELATSRHLLDCLDELNRSQWFSREDLLALQRSKMYKLLVYAYSNVPYYRRTFQQAAFRPEEVLTDVTSLRKLPILTKATIRENFDDLLTTESTRRGQMRMATTSGSTDDPLKFMQDNDFLNYVIADRHRNLAWAGWKLGTPHCYLWGAEADFSSSQSLRARLRDWTLNRFVTNAYLLSDETMNSFISQVRCRRPQILYGYASSLYRLAEFIEQKNFADTKFKAILSAAEMLYPHHREVIEETFGCKIFDRYGTREVGGLGCQCEFHTGLHVSMENVYIEILDDEAEPTQPGEPGNIVVTNLNNYGMPFIRYSLADVISWYPDEPCPCGRALPMLSVVEGRHKDMFKTKDGRSVSVINNIPLWNIAGVKQFQLIQKAPDLVVVRVVKEGALQASDKFNVVVAIQAKLGAEVKVEFEFLEAIPLDKSGKYRYQTSSCCIIAEPSSCCKTPEPAPFQIMPEVSSCCSASGPKKQTL